MVEGNSLYGLAYNCPHLERQLDCPLMQVKHFSFREKVKWIDNLSQDEKQKMIEQYKNCSKNRV